MIGEIQNMVSDKGERHILDFILPREIISAEQNMEEYTSCLFCDSDNTYLHKLGNEWYKCLSCSGEFWFLPAQEGDPVFCSCLQNFHAIEPDDAGVYYCESCNRSFYFDFDDE